MGKPFSSWLYEQYDRSGRDAVTRYLFSLGWLVEDNPDQYGIDLLCSSPKKSIGVEVEVKTVWRGAFPFQSLHIPYRKEKFARHDTAFFILSEDLEQAAVVNGSDVKSARVVSKHTSQTDREDKFFEIPLEKVRFVQIRETPRL